MTILIIAAGIFLLLTMLSRQQTNKAIVILTEEGRAGYATALNGMRWFTVIAISAIITVFMILVYSQQLPANLLTTGYLAAFFLYMLLHHLRSMQVFKRIGLPAEFVSAWSRANLLRLLGLAVLVAAFAYYFMSHSIQ